MGLILIQSIVTSISGAWREYRLLELPKVFYIDMAAYEIMSNRKNIGIVFLTIVLAEGLNSIM